MILPDGYIWESFPADSRIVKESPHNSSRHRVCHCSVSSADVGRNCPYAVPHPSMCGCPTLSRVGKRLFSSEDYVTDPGLQVFTRTLQAGKSRALRSAPATSSRAVHPPDAPAVVRRVASRAAASK